jgi:hypothetical protein
MGGFSYVFQSDGVFDLSLLRLLRRLSATLAKRAQSHGTITVLLLRWPLSVRTLVGLCPYHHTYESDVYRSLLGWALRWKCSTTNSPPINHSKLGRLHGRFGLLYPGPNGWTQLQRLVRLLHFPFVDGLYSFCVCMAQLHKVHLCRPEGSCRIYDSV